MVVKEHKILCWWLLLVGIGESPAGKACTKLWYGGMFKCNLFAVSLWVVVFKWLHLNFWVTNRPSFLFSWSNVPREMEYDFLVGVGVLLALLWSFLLYPGASCKCVLPLNSQCLWLTCLQREYLSDNTLPNRSCIGTLNMWIFMQGISSLLNGQDCRSFCCCLLEDGQHQIHQVGIVCSLGGGFCFI